MLPSPTSSETHDPQALSNGWSLSFFPERPSVATKVVQAKCKDWQGIITIIAENFVHATEPSVGFWLCHQLPYFHVVRIKGSVAGFTHVQPQPESHTLWLNIIGVNELFRHKGVATQLLAQCERQALDWGLNRIGFQCYEQNIAALALYARLGYIQTGEHRDQETGLRFVVHRKDLTLPLSANSNARPPALDSRLLRWVYRFIYLTWTRPRSAMRR